MLNLDIRRRPACRIFRLQEAGKVKPEKATTQLSQLQQLVQRVSLSKRNFSDFSDFVITQGNSAERMVEMNSM